MSDIDSLLSELDAEEAPKPKRKRPALPDKFERVLDFNPDSQDDVLRLAKHLGVKLPRRKDSDDSDDFSTEKKYLKQAAKKHPIFGLILECRERWKLISTYNWVLDQFNRVHTTIGWHPSTLRKSSRDYNLQNIPKRSDLAVEFRRMVVAPPGHVIVEADSSAIEAVLVGYFAGSDRYINLARAGIHDWFNSVVHNESFSSELPFPELKAQCKAAKARYPKESREVAKRVIHATAYMTTPIKMQDEYPEVFSTVSAARKLQNMLLATPPGEDLQNWWKATHARTAHDKYLASPFGGRHRFFHIFKYNGRTQEWEPKGDDAKRCIAYLPQHSASMIQDIYVDALWKGPVAPFMRLPIHDSILTVAPSSEAADVAKAMFNTFQMPISELDGLTIGAEVSMSAPGGNWGPRSSDNPLGMETV
jgi:DNA polymerase family A